MFLNCNIRMAARIGVNLSIVVNCKLVEVGKVGTEYIHIYRPYQLQCVRSNACAHGAQ